MPKTLHRRAAGQLLTAAAAVLVLLVTSAAAAAATSDDEAALAARFAPVVRLVDQPEPCGPGEPYEPLDVDVLFDEPTVALRGPWGGSDLVSIAPKAGDLVGLYEYHLDFPGDALDPGCSYEEWARRITGDKPPTVYAHVATSPGHPGQLALQYWLFYAFNDWNNLHEGDWEMIQLEFDAADAQEALGKLPTRIGYSQHEGAEGANWGEAPLRIVDGTHPVVYPAAGSHANFYEDALFLGASGEQGVGCDNTIGPSRELHPVVHTIPSDPALAVQQYPWIAFDGRWGELQPAFFNGPTGPNLKTQWTDPIGWSEGWRDRSFAVPVGGLLGTSTTDFFCGAIAAGSRALSRGVGNPLLGLVLVGVLAAILIYLISRATWTPGTPFRVARRRYWGQILFAATRTYLRRLPLFVGIGLAAIPISIVVTLLQALIWHATSVLGLDLEGEIGGLVVLFAVLVGTVLTLLGLTLILSATCEALLALDDERPTNPLQAYRVAIRRWRPLVGSLAIATAIVGLLLSTLVLVPVAIYLTVRWALLVPAVQIDGLSAVGALGRSARLVRGGWWKAASLIVVGAALALALGPMIGFLLILLTDAPLAWLNLVGGLVYVVAMPLVALTAMYVYFDARVRHELDEPEPKRLPAEIALEPSREPT